MAHFTDQLPTAIELGAVRHLTYSNEVVTTDGGNEVRNARWGTPLRRYELTIPPSVRSGEDYQQILRLYALTMGGLHSFEFAEWVDDSHSTIVKVRFDGELSITGLDRKHDHIETFTLVEVRS